MADKSFGVRQLNLIGIGTPTIESSDTINLDAPTVAISTNVTVGGISSVGSAITMYGSTGTISATKYYGDGSQLSGLTAVGSGVGIQSNTSAVGTAQTINFVGTGVTATISGAVVTVEISTDTADTGISEVKDDITPQLGGNLDLNSKLINGTGGINITGVCTATSFSGDGSALTGLPQSGVGIKTSGGNVGFGVTFLDFRGAGISTITSPSSGISTINITGGGGGGSVSEAFKTISVSGQSDVVADSATDTLTLVAGNRMTITTNASGDSITFAASASGTEANGNMNVTAGVTYQLNTYNASTYVNTEYILFFQHTSGIQSQRVLVMDDGTNAYSEEYGIMHSNDLLVSVGATLSSGTVRLQFTPEAGVNGIVTYSYRREELS
jgi:hypothetical protein|tara:strand:- start:2385 stop:3536 length:1152 start_codon:yes stop_codon:yes gene_type:complete